MSDLAPLPEIFRTQPIAHRGLHDTAAGIAENSRAAFDAAIAAGYGIEMDVQMAADGEAMVFHDHRLQRLTGHRGSLRGHSAKTLGDFSLLCGGEAIPALPEVLARVAGRAPLLIEIKDQDGALGPAVGALECRVAELLSGYRGAVAAMSFNPHSVLAFSALAPKIPVGLTTCAFTAADWPHVPQARRERLAELPDLVAAGASFISHDKADLASVRVARAKAAGLAVLCWTIQSAAEESAARKYADNITFEGYAAATG